MWIPGVGPFCRGHASLGLGAVNNLVETQMERFLVAIGGLAGALGVLLTLVAGGFRLAGHFWVGSYSAGTVLLGGMGLMLMGSLAFQAVLTARRVSGRG